MDGEKPAKEAAAAREARLAAALRDNLRRRKAGAAAKGEMERRGGPSESTSS